MSRSSAFQPLVAEAWVGDQALAQGGDALEIVGLAERIQGQVRSGRTLGGGWVLYGHGKKQLGRAIVFSGLVDAAGKGQLDAHYRFVLGCLADDLAA
jgi:hypothetical protein